jgi:hypothetical protein
VKVAKPNSRTTLDLLSARRTHLHCLLLAALSITFQSCGGGSAGLQSANPNPNPNPTFSEIDARGTGTQINEGTYPIKINFGGVIAGYFLDANLGAHAFVRSQEGSFTIFEVPGADTLRSFGGTFAQSINASGAIAGVWDAVNDTTSHGFYRTQDGTFTTYDVPGIGYGGIANSYVNDSGVIAGTASISGQLNGFVRAADGTFSVFILPDSIGLNGTTLTGLNSSGVVTGYAYTGTLGFQTQRGFIRTAGGTVTEFDAPGIVLPCNCGTQPADINDSGAIVGVTYQGPEEHSFVRTPDGVIAVFDPPDSGSRGSFAALINASGLIVGGYWDTLGTERWYIRNLDGSFTMVSPDLLPAIETGATTIYGINANGAIVGTLANTLGGIIGFLRQ